MNTPRENRIIHVVRNLQYSKDLEIRFVANMVRLSFETDGFCNIDCHRPPIGPLLKDNFPQMVRVNRHHRRKFFVDKDFTNALSIGPDGEKIITTLRRPAIINKIIYKKA